MVAFFVIARVLPLAARVRFRGEDLIRTKEQDHDG